MRSDITGSAGARIDPDVLDELTEHAGTLYEMTRQASYALVAVVLLTVALLACALPARRAARLEPVALLRHT